MRAKHFPFIKEWIDLDHVQAVGDAYFEDLMGHGGWFVNFHIQFSFRNSHTIYKFRMEDFADTMFKDNRHWAQTVDGIWVDRVSQDGKELLAVYRLQCKIDELVKEWKGD